MSATLRRCLRQSSSTELGRVLFALLGIHVGAPHSLSAQEPEAFGGATVSLPPFYVEPENGEDWTRVTSGGFELLTTNDRTFAREFTLSYFQQTHLISQIIPLRYLWEPHIFDTFIVVNRKNRRLQADDALGRIIEKTQSNLTSRSARERYVPNLRLLSADSSINFAFLNEGDLGGRGSHSRQFFFDDALAAPGASRRTAGFRFSTNRLKQQLATRAPALPVWAITGLVDLYDHGEFSQGRIVIDPLKLPPLVVVEDSATPPSLALPLLVLLTQTIPDDHESKQIWVKHAHLFVRWCLFAEDGKFRDALWKFVDDSVAKSPNDERFLATFGLSIAEAQLAIEQFFTTATSKKISLTASRNQKRPDVKIEPASRIEVSRLLAEWERLETEHMRKVYPGLTETYLQRARKTIASARQNGSVSTALQSTSGLLEYAAGNTAYALAELTSAVEAGETRPLVLQVLARLIFEEATANQLDDEAVPIEAVQPAIDLLLRAHRSDSTFVAIYLDLSEIWDTAAHPLSVNEVAVLAAGIRHFPRDLVLVNRLVRMQAARGKWKTARSILQFAETRAMNAEAVQFIAALGKQLDDLEPSP